MSRKVAIYARVSTEHEAQLSALDNQIQYYDEIMDKHPEWELYDKYIDEGITGTSVKKRKRFMDMIQDAENGCFDLIITREVCRFARNTVDTLQVTRDLKKIGVEVWFVEDNIWTFNDEDGELKLTIMATLAQNESKKTSQRVKAGQKISFQNGVFYGTGNILGYDKVGKDLIINESQAEIVKKIFSMFLDGKGSTIIKNELERLGYKTSTGLSNWSASYITRVLQNPFYCGTIVYRKAFVPDFLEQKAKRNTGQVEKVIVEGRHTPIISKEDFDKVQKIIQTRSAYIKERQKVGKGVPQSVWTEKLKCSCGAAYNKNRYHKDKNGDITYCYICYNQKRNGSKKIRDKKGLDSSGACNSPFIPEWKLHIMANKIIDTIWEDKDELISIAKKIIDETLSELDFSNDNSKEIKNLTKRIDSLENKKDKLLNGFLAELYSDLEYTKKKQELEKEISDIKEKITELEKNSNYSKKDIAQKIKGIKKVIDDSFKYKNKKTTEEMVSSLFESIIVNDNSYNWKLKCNDDIIKTQIDGRSNSSEVKIDINNSNLTSQLDCCTSCNQARK